MQRNLNKCWKIKDSSNHERTFYKLAGSLASISQSKLELKMQASWDGDSQIYHERHETVERRNDGKEPWQFQ